MKQRFISSDIKYTIDRCKSWWKSRVGRGSYSLPSTSKDLFSKVIRDGDAAIPMRDGIKLYADVYRPKTSEKLPTVLIRMPYGKREPFCYMPTIGQYWAKKGYICVVQDVRGKWASGGTWEPFVNEKDDGYDTIDWIIQQEWSNGKVGMTGESYYGYTQLAAAVSQHPNLVCISPGDTAANIFGVWAYNSHAFCLQTMGIWCPETNSRTYANFYRLNRWHLPLIEMDDDAQISCDYFKEWIRRPLRDEYWEKINLDSHYDKITIPVLSWGGWLDTFLKGTIDDWSGIREASRRAGRPQCQHLLISATDHELTPMFTKRVGKVPVTSDVFSYDLIQEFFDYYMKGIPTRFASDDPVRVYVLGKNQWEGYSTWPPPQAITRKLYLTVSGGSTRIHSLSWEIPDSREHYLEYRYDPENPVSLSYSENLWRRADVLMDRSVCEKRDDVLLFDSETLSHSIEIVGQLKAHLACSTSAVDTDFTVALVDVAPDGYCHLVQEGLLRARFRSPDQGAQLLEPHTIYDLEIDMWATAYEFSVGHKIRVEVSSSNFDKYDRNMNNSTLPGESSEPVIATQRIFVSGQRLSYIELPHIKNKEG